MKYGTMTWEKMEKVVTKMGGESGVERFLRGEAYLAYKRPEYRNWPYWVSVNPVTNNNCGWTDIINKGLAQSLREKGIMVDDQTKGFLDRVDSRRREGKMGLFEDNSQFLTKTTAIELLGCEYGTWTQVLAAAEAAGLRKCSRNVIATAVWQWPEEIGGRLMAFTSDDHSALNDGCNIAVVRREKDGIYFDITKCEEDAISVGEASTELVFEVPR